MTRKSNKSHSAVERLIEQRRQYQDWLAKLDADASAAAPSHVTDRVREDYASRLESVTEELRQHEDGVRQALMEASAQVEELLQERLARTDELAEARLRRQVGEFDEDRFEEVQTRCKAALNELMKEISTGERDIERLEEVLAMMLGGPVEEPPQAAAPPPRPAEAVAPPPPPPAPAPAKPQGQMNVDELEFLRSVVDSPKSPTARSSVVLSSVPTAAPPPPAQAPEPPPPPPPAPRPVAPPPPPPPPPAPKAKERRPSETAREAESNAKTLRCGECGTMNPPTEWYCEKCGAELSTF